MSSTHTTADGAREAVHTRAAKDRLKAFVERIERLEEEKKTIADDIRDIYAEAKGTGFDVPALRAIIKLRKIDANTRNEQSAILDSYMNALGMLPLFEHDPTPNGGGSSGSSSKSGAGGGSTPKSGATHGASAASSDGEGPAPSTLAATYPASPSASRRGGPSPETTDLACLASAAGELELGAPSSLPASTLQGSGPPPVTTEVSELPGTVHTGGAAGGRQPMIARGVVLPLEDHPGIPPEFLRGSPLCFVRPVPPEVRPP